MGTLFFIQMAGRGKLQQNMHLDTVVCETGVYLYATGTALLFNNAAPAYIK